MLRQSTGIARVKGEGTQDGKGLGFLSSYQKAKLTNPFLLTNTTFTHKLSAFTTNTASFKHTT